MEKAEKIGLGIAAAGHVALFAVLSLSILTTTNDAFRNKPIEVMIADEVGLESAAPDPAKITPATSVAPELGAPDESSFVVPEPLPEPPKAEAKPKPAVAPAPVSREPRRRPDKPASTTAKSEPKPQPKPRGSRLGDDFLKGVTDAPSVSRNQNIAAEKASPAVQSSIQAEITRQLKPHWTRLAPTGADAELLVTKLRFKLNRDGSLAGLPENLGTSGRTASNAPQVSVHGERAIAAVRSAAPFQLPEKFYDVWKEVTYDFDKRL